LRLGFCADRRREAEVSPRTVSPLHPEPRGSKSGSDVEPPFEANNASADLRRGIRDGVIIALQQRDKVAVVRSIDDFVSVGISRSSLTSVKPKDNIADKSWVTQFERPASTCTSVCNAG
jgi:hypothetical protein